MYGVLTDRSGRPVAVDVYPGNTADPSTVPDQVNKLKQRFGLEQVILVGDRGMLTQTQIETLKQYPGTGWISALRSEKLRQLVEQQFLQRPLFDQQNLAEIHSPDFPGERLIVCFNSMLAEERQRKRQALLEATEESLEKLAEQVRRRTKTPLSAAEIGRKVGRIIDRFKVAKHFETAIADGQFGYQRRTEAIQREAELDGIYVIRTSEPEPSLSAEDTVRSYKNLPQVERAFRTLKGVDLQIRPIYHRTEDRVRACPSSSACWLISSNGICVRPWLRCCLMTRKSNRAQKSGPGCPRKTLGSRPTKEIRASHRRRITDP
ncbi:MAG: IS1634 family transposase [Methylococcaceae bacterium]|nr:IS1634 family transposase [Methylococcaceae bacterium]MCI0667944.1 IS1634 family transposase [Methylococcaceae bacterium]